MEKKSVTFLVVSNRKGTTRKLTISAGWLKASAVAGVVLMVVGAACVVDYVGLLSESIENRRLRTENAQLKQQFEVVEGKLAALESSLERVKGFVTKLRLITSVDDDNRTLKLAMGPLSRQEAMGGSEASPDRQVAGMNPGVMAERFAEQDAVFAQRPPPDELRGEVAVEPQHDYASLAVRIDQAVQDTSVREEGILELWSNLRERDSLMRATPSIKPVRGWFTSKFGYRVSPFTNRPMMHQGLDIAAAPGSPIYSPGDGIVSFAGYDPGYGKLVSIDHGYGVVTRFGHTSQIFVEVGQKVSRRDIIASVGNTGRSTGPHLHYEVRVNSVPVDPMNYVLDE